MFHLRQHSFCTLFRCGRPRWGTRKPGGSLHASAARVFPRLRILPVAWRSVRRAKQWSCKSFVFSECVQNLLWRLCPYVYMLKASLFFFFSIMVHWVIQYSTVHWVPVWFIGSALRLGVEHMHHCLAWFFACWLFICRHSGLRPFCERFLRVLWVHAWVWAWDCQVSLRQVFAWLLFWGYFQNQNFLNFPLRHQSPILHPQFVWQFLILWFCYCPFTSGLWILPFGAITSPFSL